MIYADKGLSLFALMNDMSDELINESDIRGCAVIKPKRERSGRFSAFMNHPAMVAALCAVVSLGVVVAIVLAGRGGPAVLPVVGTLPTESEISSPGEESEDQTLTQDRIDPDEYISVYLELTDVFLTLESFMVWRESEGYSVDGVGFQGECNSGELVLNCNNFIVYILPNCEFQSVTVYSGSMAKIATATEPTIHQTLEGYYYVALRIKIQHDTGASCYDYVFPLSLCNAVEGLNFEVVYREETFTTAESETSQPTEPETRYEPTEQVRDYTLIPHTPTAGINDNYFLISMTATEPGKALTAAASYQLYRLNGDEEELIHNYDVELAVYEEPAGPEDYAVYETGVSLVWAKSNLEAKGDTLTPGWYRVKFGRATLDFELVDKTGQAPAVHPFAELSVPTMVYTSMSTEDMALYEQYERIYTSKDKIEKLWAFFTKLTVTEANPPENIRSGDGLGIHVTYPDGTKGRIFFWGEQHEYFYIDDGPWYQAPPEEVAALMTQIKNVMSDPT